MRGWVHHDHVPPRRGLIRDALEEIGAPTTARGLGLTAEDVIDAMTHAHEIRSDRFTILGDSGISPEVAEKVARATGVI